MRRGFTTAAIALVAVLAFAAPAFAAPTGGESTPATEARGVNLRLDGRVAGRLLADAKESSGATDDDKAKSGEKSGEKSDEIKMTVSKGGAAKKSGTGSEDTFAFVKDWPFWAIVGGVVIIGATVFMINRNSNQEHSCSAVYNAGCFGAK